MIRPVTELYNMPRIHPVHPVNARHAFSLIELLVTISIIVLLVGISFPVALKLLAGADTSRAKSTLNALGAAAAEFRTQTGAMPDHTAGGLGIVVTANNDQTDNSMGLFLRQAMQISDVNKMVQSAAGKNTFTRTPGGTDTAAAAGSGIDDWVMIDPWDNRIRYVAKVSHSDGFNDDDYLPPHPTAYFASAGPDGLWGTHADDGTPSEEALDNLYSFEID